jgi:DnaJ-class molecular chaperone
MRIPPNVKTGQKIRAKGKGVLDAATSLRGDQITRLNIEMPENVDAEFKKAIEEWNTRKAKGAL